MGRFLGISRETDPSATAFGSHWYRKERVKRVYKAYEKKEIGIAAVVSKLTTATSRSRPPTAPFDHKNVLHGPKNTKDHEGAPLRSMYIDDQAEEDTDAGERECAETRKSTFVRANLAQAQEQWLKGGPRPRVPTPPPFRWLEDRASPTPPGQDMEVEQEGETLAGSPNSMDEESGSETETEEYLPPPSSKTTVAYVISARIRRYFDEQAEDSDEDAGEEREEEEQEMEEDREFVDDTAVDEDFVHRLPSNKDDAREVEKWGSALPKRRQDCALQARRGERSGGRGSPRELVLYNKAKNLRTNMQIAEFERALHWEMLADVDVEPHTWVRAPDQFDCPRRLLSSAGKVSVQVRNVQYVAEMVSQSGAFLRGNRAVRGKHAEWIIASRARKAVSRSRQLGIALWVTTGDRKDSTGIITVAMAQVLPPAPKPYPKGKGPIAPVKPPKPFEVGLAQLKRHALDLYYHFRIHDRVRVVSGALYVGAIGRVEEVEGDFLTVAIPKDWEVAGATWPSPTSDVTKLFIISIVHVTRQWAIGDSVRVTRGQYEGQAVTWSYSRQMSDILDMRMCPIHAKFAARTWTSSTNFGLPRQQIVCPPPVGAKAITTRQYRRPSLYPSRARASAASKALKSLSRSRTIFIALSKEAKKRERGEGHIHIPHKGFIGMIIGDFDSRERSDRLKNGVEPPPERHTGKLLKPVDSTRLRNPDVAGIMVTIRGDHSLETVQVPIENVRHFGAIRWCPWSRLVFFRPPFCSGGNRLNHPRIHALSPIEAPSAATPKRHHLLPDLQLPSLRMRLYGDHIHRWKVGLR
ncbi:hypothetical protein B0H14DRAFT_2602790 [Mycena olivaceomarginata]|nr:hypothetical protein B0H14DRAFT_2602790 [Mycena olivaceomarginata]